MSSNMVRAEAKLWSATCRRRAEFQATAAPERQRMKWEKGHRVIGGETSRSTREGSEWTQEYRESVFYKSFKRSLPVSVFYKATLPQTQDLY